MPMPECGKSKQTHIHIHLPHTHREREREGERERDVHATAISACTNEMKYYVYVTLAGPAARRVVFV